MKLHMVILFCSLLVVIITTVLVGSSRFANCQVETKHTFYLEVSAATIEKLRDELFVERYKATESILHDRGILIQELVCIINDNIGKKGKEGIVGNAMSLLGEIRADDTAYLLVNNLTFRTSSLHANRIPTATGDYPAVGSLIKIGVPSLNPLIEKIESTDDKTVYSLTANVFIAVLGKDVAITYVKQRITQENKIKSQRIRRLVELLDK